MNKERKEAWFRVIVGIVNSVVLGLWAYLACVLGVLNWFIVMFTGKRNKDMAELCEYWNTTYYHFYRYMTFVSNERPFPFNKLRRISKFK